MFPLAFGLKHSNNDGGNKINQFNKQTKTRIKEECKRFFSSAREGIDRKQLAVKRVHKT